MPLATGGPLAGQSGGDVPWSENREGAFSLGRRIATLEDEQLDEHLRWCIA